MPASFRARRWMLVVAMILWPGPGGIREAQHMPLPLVPLELIIYDLLNVFGIRDDDIPESLVVLERHRA